MDDQEFNGLMSRARDGDAQAVTTLLLAFEEDVRTIVRFHLPRSLRAKFDSMDFVQSVWTSVFTGSDENRAAFQNARHFRGYLAGVARNKVFAEFRRRTKTGKYDLSREEPLYIRRKGRDQPRPFASSDPSPSQEVQAADRLGQLTTGRSAAEARVVELRSLGLTIQEIADHLGIHERTVRRIIDALRPLNNGEEPQS